MRKPMCFLTSAMVLIMLIGFPIGAVQADKCELPDFFSANFDDPTPNPYFPLEVGTTFVYVPVPNDDEDVDTITVTNSTDTFSVFNETTQQTKYVTCIGVSDVETVGGDTVEETTDWYALDHDGNVWYCGEDTIEYLEDGTTSTEGSWRAGEDGALPGYLIRAADDLRPGICYQQESYDDEAQDMAKVLRLNAKVTLISEDSELAESYYEDCLMTKEWSPLERGDIEQKYYAKGVGLVLNFEHHGKIVRYELISVTSP